jgi:hypothetical protein
VGTETLPKKVKKTAPLRGGKATASQSAPATQATAAEAR